MNKIQTCRQCNTIFSVRASEKICVDCIKTNKTTSTQPCYRKYEKLCEHCHIQYEAKEYKRKYCNACLSNIECFCSCGCGSKLSRPIFKVETCPQYLAGHGNRGKTYKEIFGNRPITCGFKPGKLNPMANAGIVKRMMSSVKKRDILLDNYKFSNNYELNTYKYLKSVFPKYFVKYESVLVIFDKIYLPDFLIIDKDDNMIELFEVSGFASAYPESRQRNYEKLKHIRNHYPNLTMTFISTVHLLQKYNFDFKINTLDYKNIIDYVRNSERV